MLLALGGLVALVLLAILWKLFLDPAGKVCWEWKAPDQQSATRILASGDSGVTVLAGNTVVVLDPLKGTVGRTIALPTVGSADAEKIDLEQEQALELEYGWPGRDGSRNLHLLSDGSILRQTHDTLVRLGTDGKALFTSSFDEGRLGCLALSPDLARAYYVATLPLDLAVARKGRELLKQAQAEMRKAFDETGGYETGTPGAGNTMKALRQKLVTAQEMLAQTGTRLVCLDLQSGKELWASPKLKKGTAITALSVGPKAAHAVFLATPATPAQPTDKTTGASLSLLAFGAADGSRIWQTELPATLAWGPVPAGDLVLIQAGEQLTAFAADGTVAYTLNLPEKAGLRPLLRDGLLLLVGGDSCRCLDATTGKEKWGVLLATGEGDIVVASTRIYLAGQIEERLADKDVKLPPAYKELEKMPEFSHVLEQAKRKVVQVVLAVERESGRELWRVRHAYGIPLGDDRRFILVADTARTGAIEMVTGGKGTTLIRQFNARNGKQMYARQSDLGFAEPCLVGKRVVGLTYPRQPHASIFNPGAGQQTEPASPQGVAAYRVR